MRMLDRIWREIVQWTNADRKYEGKTSVDMGIIVNVTQNNKYNGCISMWTLKNLPMQFIHMANGYR